MKKFLVVLCAMLLVFAIGGVASANLITNGSFENPDNPNVNYLTLYETVDPFAIPGWEVYGSVDWIRNYWPASDGNWSLDLAGYQESGLVASDYFPTTPGQWYKVEFDMAGNPDQGYDKALIGVAIGNDFYMEEFSFSQALGTKADMGWQTKSFSFLATDDEALLAFGDNTDHPGDESWGAAIDNIKVAPVPEPATMLLLGSGLIGLAAFRRSFIKR